MQEIEKNFQTSSGINITYRVCSSNRNLAQNKTVVLLLHGLASNMTRWTEFLSSTEIAASNDTIRMDLRGHGKSMVNERITVKNWCTDLYRILEIENYSNTIIIGHSLGAQIAQNFAVLYPQNTLGIVLIDPVYATALKGILKVIGRFRPVLFVIIYLLLIKSKLIPHKLFYPYRDLFELDQKTRTILKQQPEVDIAKIYMSPQADLKYISLLNYCQDLYEVTRKTPELNKINCSVLGLLSKGASVSNIETTKYFLKQFKNSEILVINADHWLLTEKPKESRIAIDRWCCQLLSINNG